MTVNSLRHEPFLATTSSRVGGRNTQVLASALAHLLGRDGERPARWTVDAFGRAVEEARGRLFQVAAVADLAPEGATAAGELDFHEASRWLAGHPGHVAVAIRRIELDTGRRLPAWSDLVVRGMPARPTDLDTSLWFG